MPNPNAIVSLVARVEPALEGVTAEELLRQHPEGVRIEFEGADAVVLLPSPTAAARLEILEQLRQLHTPAYVEINPDTRAIDQLLIPLVSNVTATKDAEGGVDVELESSHARHFLARDHPDFSAIEALLNRAAGKGIAVAATETDTHQIIDLREWAHDVPGGPKRGGGLAPGPLARRFNPLMLWFWRWWRLRWRIRCPGSVSVARAQQLFDLAATKTCDPLAVPAPCIPFLYPDDGCWARAHEMCRLMEIDGAQPKKVWIDGNLHTLTKNHPACFVNWGWHVAPTVCVRRRWWSSEDMVLDPALFTTPVSLTTWKAAQGDTAATLAPSAASLYWRVVMPSDPSYVDTNYRLTYYRLQLKNRSLQPAGPPPYAFCP